MPEKSPSRFSLAHFPPDIIRYLDEVETWCKNRNMRLTKTRREVLGLVLSSEKPLGAYDLLDRLKQTQPRAVPPTIYRALDFLLENGLIHRIERLSAFIGCDHALHCHTSHMAEDGTPEDGPDHAGSCHHDIWGSHRAQFLICRHCGHVQELEQDVIAGVLMAAAKSHGFRAEAAIVEVEGLCAACSPALAGKDIKQDSPP